MLNKLLMSKWQFIISCFILFLTMIFSYFLIKNEYFEIILVFSFGLVLIFLYYGYLKCKEMENQKDCKWNVSYFLIARIIKPFFTFIYQYMELALVIIYALLIIALAIDEINQRNIYNANINNKINDLYKKSIHKEKNDKKDILVEVKLLEEKLEKINNLNNYGAYLTEDTLHGFVYKGKINKYLDYNKSNPISNIKNLLSLSYASSNMLLIILCTLSSVLGIVIISIINEKTYPIREVTKGLITGFIVFALVKGGISVFTNNNIEFSFNPFNIMFISILAGMFSGKFYELLKHIFDTFINKVTKNEPTK